MCITLEIGDGISKKSVGGMKTDRWHSKGVALIKKIQVVINMEMNRCLSYCSWRIVYFKVNKRNDDYLFIYLFVYLFFVSYFSVI